MRLRVLQVAKVDDIQQTMTVEMAVGLSWIEPRLLFNNIFDWDERRSVKVRDILWQRIIVTKKTGELDAHCSLK